MGLSRIWPGSAELDRLIVAARGGSREALGTLLERCRDYLLLVAGRELGRDLQGKVGASDLVQETFVRAQDVFGSFQGSGEAELLGWLRRMLLNHILTVRRHYSDTLKRDIGARCRGPVTARFGRPSRPCRPNAIRRQPVCWPEKTRREFMRLSRPCQTLTGRFLRCDIGGGWRWLTLPQPWAAQRMPVANCWCGR